MVEKFRHVARGTTYTFVGRATVQDSSGRGLFEGAEVVVYRGDDGALWARSAAEFMDGRFQRLTDHERG